MTGENFDEKKYDECGHPLPLRYTASEQDCRFVSKDAFIGRNQVIDERCMRNDERIDGIEKKLSNIQNVVISALVGILISIGLQLFLG